jgi:putative hemolysin
VPDLALELALVGALIVLNAVFAGTEMALVRLREGQLRRLAEESEAGRALARLARDPNRFLGTIQIGITLAGFLASAVAAVSLAEPLKGPLGFLGAAAEPVAVVLVTLVLTFLTLVLGELVPKRIAMQRAERWALLTARPLSGLATVARPLVWLLGRSTDLTVRLLGGDPGATREEITEEEIRDLVVGHRRFTPTQRSIIEGAFEIADRPLRLVLIPRGQVVALKAERPAAEGVAELVRCGHSRAPVIGSDLDDVTGVVHLRDLVGEVGAVGDRARPALVLPETLDVVDALRRMQTERQQLAIVVSEYGGTEGIVTVEDLIEELVGEIYDETDRDVRAVQRQPDGAIVLAGTFPIHDLVDLGVELPEGDYATVAGLVLDRLGHLPETPGETVDIDGWGLEVLAITGRAITKVRLQPSTDHAHPPPPPRPTAPPPQGN